MPRISISPLCNWARRAAGVRHDAVDHAVHLRRAFPVFLVAYQDGVVVPRPALEDEGSGAHGRGFVQLAVHDVAEVGLVEMARQPGQSEVAQAVALDVLNFTAMVSGSITSMDSICSTCRLARRLHKVAGDGVVGELEVGGVHRVPVAPDHAGTQLEGPGETVLRDRPALRHGAIRYKLARGRVLADEAGEEHGSHRGAAGVRAEDGVERLRVGRGRPAEGAAGRHLARCSGLPGLGGFPTGRRAAACCLWRGHGLRLRTARQQADEQGQEEEKRERTVHGWVLLIGIGFGLVNLELSIVNCQLSIIKWQRPR